MNRYKDLKVWQKTLELSIEIYAHTNSFPSSEMYGLSAQIRRCAVSIPSNIAEGAGRNSKGQFEHFLGVAYGSSCELETQIIIVRN